MVIGVLKINSGVVLLMRNAKRYLKKLNVMVKPQVNIHVVKNVRFVTLTSMVIGVSKIKSGVP